MQSNSTNTAFAAKMYLHATLVHSLRRHHIIDCVEFNGMQVSFHELKRTTKFIRIKLHLLCYRVGTVTHAGYCKSWIIP